MLSIQFTIPDIESEIRGMVVRANNAAIPVAAQVALNALRPAIPVKTGAMQQQANIKYFKQQAGMIGAAVKVLGTRHFVEHILEYGARTHGGRRAKGSRARKGAKLSSKRHTADRGPIRARHIFMRAIQASQGLIEATYQSTFAANFK